jgi:hypothetical protein
MLKLNQQAIQNKKPGKVRTYFGVKVMKPNHQILNSNLNNFSSLDVITCGGVFSLKYQLKYNQYNHGHTCLRLVFIPLINY